MANSSRCDFSLKLKIKTAANKPEIAAKWLTDTNTSVSQLLWHIETKFQRLPPIFGTREHIGVSKDTARCNRKSEMKMAAGKPKISAPRWDRNVISTARSRVSELRNSVAPLRILSDVTGSQKLNMAAAKLEVLISQLQDELETWSKWLD